jgi:hypothetical protein
VGIRSNGGGCGGDDNADVDDDKKVTIHFSFL